MHLVRLTLPSKVVLRCNSGMSWKAVKCFSVNYDCKGKVKERNFITSGVVNVHLCHWVLLILFVPG